MRQIIVPRKHTLLQRLNWNASRQALRCIAQDDARAKVNSKPESGQALRRIAQDDARATLVYLGSARYFQRFTLERVRRSGASHKMNTCATLVYLRTALYFNVLHWNGLGARRIAHDDACAKVNSKPESGQALGRIAQDDTCAKLVYPGSERHYQSSKMERRRASRMLFLFLRLISGSGPHMQLFEFGTW